MYKYVRVYVNSQSDISSACMYVKEVSSLSIARSLYFMYPTTRRYFFVPRAGFTVTIDSTIAARGIASPGSAPT